MLRRLLVAALAAAVVIVISVPGTAGAAAVREVCVMQIEPWFSPRLGPLPKPISSGFVGRFAWCQGTSNVKEGYTNAYGYGTGSCAAIKTTATGDVQWTTTRQYSEFSLTITGNAIVLRVVGRFTSGLFRGLTLKADLGFVPTSSAACLLPRGLRLADVRGLATIGI